MMKNSFLTYGLWVLCLILGTGDPQQAFAFKILQPDGESPLKAGQIIPVQLDLGEAAGITQVKYYWYGEQEDMLQEFVEEKLALVSNASSDPPFGGMLTVPLTAIGNLRLLAVAEREGEDFEQENWSIFDEVLVHAEPDAALLEIDFETEKPIRFGRAGSAVVYDQVDFLGKIIELPVVGLFSDEVTRPIRFALTGTTYESSDESIVKVYPDGLLLLVGNGRATIKATNRGKQATLDVRVEVNDDPNEPPVPDSGPNQIVSAGTRVQFNALQSYDPEGGSLQYYWSQIRGSKVPLLDPYSAKASFLAPLVVGERLFRFKLRVTDSAGADSLPAFVDVVVQP